MGLTDERWRYIVTAPLIVWAHIQNDFWIFFFSLTLWQSYDYLGAREVITRVVDNFDQLQIDTKNKKRTYFLGCISPVM